MRNLLTLAGITLCLCISSVEADLVFRIQDLGTLHADSSSAYAMNDKNQVIGKFVLEDTIQFFIWDDKKFKLIDLPSTCIPKSINNNCQICGQYIADDGSTRGFIFDLINGFLDLGTLGGGNIWVEDMNESGQVVGYSETGKMSCLRRNFKEVHAFVWKNGDLEDLDALKGDIGQGGDESRAYGINDHGDVVGYSNYTHVYKGKKIASVHKACIWQKDELCEIFPDDHPASVSQAFDVNNKGEIIALVQSKPGCYELNYFDLSTNKKAYLACGLQNRLDHINENGIVINYFCSMASLLSSEEGYHDIILTDNFFWKNIKTTYSINNNNIIVGEAENIYGEIHGVILLPEERASSSD